MNKSVLFFSLLILLLASCKTNEIKIRATDFKNSSDSFHLIKSQKSIEYSSRIKKKRTKKSISAKNIRISNYNKRQIQKAAVEKRYQFDFH